MSVDIPVFCYHNAFAETLAADLAFLLENGYTTLTASEVVDVLTGAMPAPEKAVALTFDDGLLSLKTVGLPLFERYDAKATVFAITGLTPDGTSGPGGADVSRDADDLYRLLGWDDLRALQASGRVEIGSHGHRHNPVHVAGSEEHPLRFADYDRLYDVPVPYRRECDEPAIRALEGSASRPSRPLFETDVLWIDGEAVAAREAILDDLRASVRLLSEHLDIDRPHLCLPYGAGNEAMPELAREAGFASIFWSRRDDRDANRPGDDPYRIVRRKHDFVRRLAGRGRRSLAGIYWTKVARRLTSDPWA